MTKVFYVDNKHPFDWQNEFYKFFDEDNIEKEYFNSILMYSFEVVIMNNEINSVRWTIKESEASFNIWGSDCYVRPAGTVNVTCTTDLLWGFVERINSPKNFTMGKEGKWEN